MTNQALQIKSGFFELSQLRASSSDAKNLFIITHLGQLKQMQALIRQNNLSKNMLVVLYTYKNIQVPSDVQDDIDTSLFSKVVFVKIPYGLQKVNIQKIIRLNQLYKKILSLAKFDTLYINSFEGHYGIVLSLARANTMRLILVEEGTATYKPKTKTSLQIVEDGRQFTQDFVRQSFMKTVGQSQMFKKMVKAKKTYQQNRNISNAWKAADISHRDTKLFKQFGTQIGRFGKTLWVAPATQNSMVDLYGKVYPIIDNEPFLDFDVVYASHADLLSDDFGQAQLKQFFAYGEFDAKDLSIANAAVEEYQINENDVLFISQRYAFDLRLYMKEVDRLLRQVAMSRRVFIKLHPKENDFILQMYHTMSKISRGQIVILENCSKIPAESLIAASSIKTIIGMTSSTLIYAPLIRQDVQVVSIAQCLINRLQWSPECQTGISVLQQHLAILERFDGIAFAQNNLVGEVLC